ncbi:hypothetical protein BP5796_06303 [Coleophoma crateriformis]|uniref:Uncharacterized protein n=1 Tax=Coleophoma crateriformis TaxID=565419 RepID=A0A3D8RXB6_9HELO|nr:hypothetical protein BP5796_06303 [Coleophoma crateriformis]
MQASPDAAEQATKVQKDPGPNPNPARITPAVPLGPGSEGSALNLPAAVMSMLWVWLDTSRGRLEGDAGRRRHGRGTWYGMTWHDIVCIGLRFEVPRLGRAW